MTPGISPFLKKMILWDLEPTGKVPNLDFQDLGNVLKNEGHTIGPFTEAKGCGDYLRRKMINGKESYLP